MNYGSIDNIVTTTYFEDAYKEFCQKRMNSPIFQNFPGSPTKQMTTESLVEHLYHFGWFANKNTALRGRTKEICMILLYSYLDELFERKYFSKSEYKEFKKTLMEIEEENNTNTITKKGGGDYK